VSLSEADLQAYFDRIHFSGEARPDRETLAALVAAHTASIPFENLNPLLGLPVALDPQALVAKLVRQQRGGYCYEQNGLFGHVLETIGFGFTPLAARVLWRQSEDALTPRTHKLLLVELAEATELCAHPLHPYTQALLVAALPAHPDDPQVRLTITGEVPSALAPPAGCRFHTRCPRAMPRCSQEAPVRKEIAPNHSVACHLYD